MKHLIFRPGCLWINFNIALFCGYTIFAVPSFFWPVPLKNVGFIFLHLLTLLVDIFVVYGLVVRRFRINYLIVLISIVMVAHLLLFIFVPLGMVLAYIGPSRAFYTLFLTLMSQFGGGKFSSYALMAFNSVMIVIHLKNISYFRRKDVAALFHA
jgi:hypothetical protein